MKSWKSAFVIKDNPWKGFSREDNLGARDAPKYFIGNYVYEYTVDFLDTVIF